MSEREYHLNPKALVMVQGSSKGTQISNMNPAKLTEEPVAVPKILLKNMNRFSAFKGCMN